MAIQPTPPIQLDPSMDTGHQLAFINQNFNNIASVIGQNSFVIALSGTTTISPPASWPTSNVQTITIPHNFSFTPMPLVFVTVPAGIGYIGGSGTTQLPATVFGTETISPPGVTFGIPTIYTQARTDTANLYIDLTNIAGFTINGYNVYTWTYKYYLLQQTAS